jgi:hypothetical protein
MVEGENPIYFFEKRAFNNLNNEGKFVVNIFEHYENKHLFKWLGPNLSFKWVFGIHKELNIEDIIKKTKQHNNYFFTVYLSNPEEAIPEEFDDAMFYISNKAYERIKRVKELLRDNKINTNIIVDYNDIRNLNKYEYMLMTVAYFDVHKLIENDNELKKLIFNLIPDNEISKDFINYREIGVIYRRYKDSL